MVFSPSSKPLFSSKLVGRADELKMLADAFAQVAGPGGKPRVLFIGGEAGLGKSRLCRAFAEELNVQGANLLLGQATLQDQTLAFGPFLEALRRYFQTLAAIPSELQPLVPYLSRLLPELTQLSAKNNSPAQATDLSLDSIQEQHRLFHAVLVLLHQIAENNPVVLILEDLHWADETSLELLAYLTRHLSNANLSSMPGFTSGATANRILIVATYRSNELTSNSAQARMLRQLTRQRLAEEIQLTPLSVEAHRTLLETIFEQPVSPDFAELLYERTEGNPFFTEEILSAMANAGQLRLEEGRWLRQSGLMLHLPLSLRASVLERFESLDATAQRALNYASVVGRAFDFDLLLHLTGLDERSLLAILRQTINLQLIEECSTIAEYGIAPMGEERYQFRHALTREVIYNELLTRERRLLHHEVAQAIEALGKEVASEEVQRLAHHYYLAGVPEKAHFYAREAAERARYLFAFLEERHHLQIALNSLPKDVPARLPLLERLGLVNLGLLDVPAAVNWTNQAIEGHQKLGQTRRAGVLLANLSFVVWFFDTPHLPRMLAEIEAVAQAAYAGTDNQGEPDLDALQLYAKTAFSYASADKHRQADLWIERTLELSERLKNESRTRSFGQMAGLLVARGLSRIDSGSTEIEEGLADIRRTLDFGRQYNIPNLVMLSYSSLLMALIELGRSEASDALIAEMEEYEARSGTPPLANGKGYHYFLDGRWEDGMRLLQRDIEQTARMGTTTTNALDWVMLSHYLIERGQLSEAQTRLEAALPRLEPLEQFSFISYCLWGLAKVFAAQNQPRKASYYYSRCYELWKETEDRGTVIPVLLDGIFFFLQQQDKVQARQWLDDLQQIAQLTANPVAEAAFAEAESALLASENRAEAALKRLLPVADLWSELKRPYRRAAVLVVLGELYLNGQPSRERREEAQKVLTEATILYEQLNVPAGLKSIAEINQSSALSAQEKRRTTLQASRQQFGDLTPREREVLSHITAGRTNKEIAFQLHISEGTVELHVSRILGKLGCDTRTQAAAYAVEKGWATSQLETT